MGHRGWIALAACVLGAAGCDATPVGGHGSDGGGSLARLVVRGRIVDAETCSDATRGCQPVRGAVVAAAGATDIRSEPTGGDGAFRLDGLPRGFASDLLVIPQDTAGARYAPTLNPAIVPADSSVGEIFGVELYVLPRDAGSLLAALRTEASIDLLATGGYVGQAVLEAGRAPVDGASVLVYPAQGPLRYVNVLPSVAPGELALRPDTATTTGPFGIFLFAATAPRDDLVVLPSKDGIAFTLLATRVRPGEVVFAVHFGR